MSRKYVVSAVKYENRSNGAISTGAHGIKSNGGGVKIDTDDDNFTHMQNRRLKDKNTKICMWGRSPM